MAARWLSAAALVLACLGWGSAKADITYTLYSADNPSGVLLEFTVSSPPPSPGDEGFSSRPGGFLGVFYASVGLAVRPPGDEGYELDFGGGGGAGGGYVAFELTGPPGNGAYRVSGELTVTGISTVYLVGSATVSGVPVGAPAIPEPATWVMLLLGAAGIMAASGAARRRHDEAASRPAPARTFC
jgi:hypothetical protein